MSDLKARLRRLAYSRRNAQPNREMCSRAIGRRLFGLPAYAKANTVMCYVHCRSEVCTDVLLQRISGDKRCVIPYCTHDSAGERVLGLWLFKDLSELVAGTWGILEPPPPRWTETGRCIDVHSLDLIVVPGVAFSRQGARLGNGAGYYDRLLNRVRADTVLVGLAYESQLVDDLPMQAHDVFMDYVITEKAVYQGKGR